MKIRGNNKHLYMMPEGGDDPGASGTGTAPPPPPPVEETLSKAEADRREAQLRRKYERQQKEHQKKLDEALAEIEKLKSKPAPPPKPNGDGKTGDPAVDGKLEIMETKFNRQIEELQGQVKQSKDVAEEERKKRLQLERQQLIDKALGEAGVVTKHMVQARRFFDPQIEWDQVEEKWMFRTTSGNIVEISEGITAEMPDNLKSTRMKGGAGTTAGMPAQKKAAHNALAAAKKKREELAAEIKRSGPKNHLLAQFSRAKNEVIRLEKELENRN